MQTFILIGLITVSTLLIISILSQQMGSSIGGSFGGTGTNYQTRRGLEKRLLQAATLLAVLMSVLSLSYLII